jgi:hypothetical protein
MQYGQEEIKELVRTSSLIFTGRVVALGASSVANLPPQPNFALVTVDRAERSDPALGELRGRQVTVVLHQRGELQESDRAVFFTLDWIHGGGIAAREVGHVDAGQEAEVSAELARLPERHLAERLANAVLVVIAEVRGVKPTLFDIRWRNAPQWAAALLDIGQLLSGKSVQKTTVLFPTSLRPTWLSAPRLEKGQRAIFILHQVPAWTVLPESGTNSLEDRFTALDPADVQPLYQQQLIEKLLNERRI